MPEITLTRSRIQMGIYEGVLIGAKDHPNLTAFRGDSLIEGLSVEADPEAALTWHVRLELPNEVVNDGVQSFAITDVLTGQVLDSFWLITGDSTDDVLLAEVALMRAELDMLKKAFRRHCVETGK